MFRRMDAQTKSPNPSPGPSGQRRTPANVPNARRELVPLPMRVAVSQKSRLDQARQRTGISIQEHVRRAIDLYLAVIEREAIELGLIPADRSVLAAERPPETSGSDGRRKPPKVRRK